MRQTEAVVGTAAAAPSSTVHEWDRFDRIWGALFHVTLGVPTVVALVGPGFEILRAVGLLATVAVVVVARQLAARALVGVAEGSRRHLTVGLLWGAATVAAMVLLVNAEDAFFFAIYGLFPQAFMMLPRTWAIVFDAALVPVVLVGADGVSTLEDPGVVASIVGSALSAPVIGLFFHSITRQSKQRHLAIVALEAAQDEAESLLQASLALNRARDPEEVVAAVGACLADHGVETLALCAGAECLASWSAPGQDLPSGTARSTGNVTTVKIDGPGPGPDMEVWLDASGPTPLGASSRRTLETLATSCGLALANFRLVEQARERGVSEERARLAREIHDTLAQGFVSVLTQLEAASEPLSRSPEEVVQRVERASRIARASLGEARRSMQALRPGALEAAPLPEAIERVVARWSDDVMVAAQVTTTGRPISLPPATEVTLLRATQEALANVARHANAASVSVTLSFLGDAVVLDVHDDGRGFDPTVAGGGANGGFGLEALRQRVDTTGGFFGLESEPGGGTTVTVHIPVVAS